MYTEGQYTENILPYMVVDFLHNKGFASKIECCYCGRVGKGFVVNIGNKVSIILSDFDAVIESEDYRFNTLDITILKRAWRRFVYLFQEKEDRPKYIEDFNAYIDKDTFGIDNFQTTTI